MTTQLLKISFIGIFSIMLFACSKKSSSTPTPAPPSQFTVNGVSYSAGTQLTVPNATAIQNGTFNPTIPAGGGYVSYTSTYVNNSITYYQYVFGQESIPTTGDSVNSLIIVESLTPIVAGTYTIFGTSDKPNSLPFAVESFSNTNLSYNDSTATGKLVISSINTTNKTISGTYSYTATGTKGSSPATITVTNGQLNNIGFQQF
jgi:hypothetical protein